MSLWNGAKVFLSQDSLVYKYLKSIGLVVFSIQRDLNEREINTFLSKDEIMDNRRIVSDNFSNEAVLAKVEVMLKKALS